MVSLRLQHDVAFQTHIIYELNRLKEISIKVSDIIEIIRQCNDAWSELDIERNTIDWQEKN